MKKKILNAKTGVFLSGLLIVSSLLACSGSDKETINNDPPIIEDPDNPNPAPKFDKNDFKVTLLDPDPYKPGDNRLYVNYTVKNLNTTKSYNINDNEWDILFKVKATDGYEFSNYVNVLSVEPESTYEHGLSIPVSTGKTLDVSTLNYEIVPSID